MKSRFDEAAMTWDTSMRIERAQQIAEILQDKLNLNETMELFELGTGTGLLSFYLAPAVKNIIAGDNSEGMLQVLTEKLKETGVKNIFPVYFDLEKELEIANKFDVIFSMMVLHHIEDLANAAAKLAQMLKNGGKIAIVDLVKEDGDFHHDHTGVKHFGFAEAELREAFGAAGFKKIMIEVVFTIQKEILAGEMKDFELFLLTAER